MEIIPNGQFLPPKLFAQILLVMRLTILFLTLGFLHVSAKSFSQEKITLNVKNMTLDEVFKEVTRQSGYYFWSGSGMPELNERVDVSVKEGSIKDVLDQCLKGLGLAYTISDKMVFVKKEEPAKMSGNVEFNGIDVKGKVTDENGEPLVGATISIKNEKVMAATNDKGEFFLHGVDPNALVTISNIGYEPIVVHLSGRSSFNFSLKQKIGILDETQIIAYGTTTQRYSVGSISKVSSDDIASQPVTNVLGALEGRVPGMVVMQSSGAPGASFSVQVRGNNALGSSPNGPVLPSSPLFVIDGVPFAPQNNNINQFNSLASPSNGLPNNLFSPGLSPFNSINPSDIESIEVLKDAEATSIYGSRGANGVVLITTKKGSVGKTKFSITAYTGENSSTRTVKMMNTPEYLAMRHEAFNNDGLAPNAANQAYDLITFDTTSYTDWRSVFLGGTAHNTNINGTLSGGDKNTQFLVGGGFHHVGNIFPGGFFEDGASVNTSIHHSSINQRLTVDFSSNYSYDENNSSGAPSVLDAFTLAPDYPSLLNPDGSLVWNYQGLDLGQLSGVSNPLAYLKEKYQATNYNLIGSLQIAYKILPGLVVKANFGYNTFNGKELSESPAISQDPSYNPVGSSRFGTNDYETWIVEPQLEYHKNILRGKLNVLIGGTFEKFLNDMSNVNASGYNNDNLLGSISAAGSTSAYDSYNEDKYAAAFGRINYVLKEKYIISGTARRDGSSRFGSDRQFGNFGSVGGGWIFSQERFMRSLNGFWSFGKLRANYGTTGSDNIGDYQYQSNWAPYSSSSSYQGIRGYYPKNLANPYYNWEVNKKINAGLDLGFAKDRILLDIDIYKNRCGNQLIYYQLPSQTGFTSVVQNSPATVQNTGIEVQAQSTNLKSRSFSWTTTFNISIPKNKLVSYPNFSTSPYFNTYKIGQPLSVLQKYVSAGVNDTTGVFQFKTAKGGLTYNPEVSDYAAVGNLDPKFYGGFRNTLRYKGLSLDIFAQFTKQTGLNYEYAIYDGGGLPGFFNNNVPELVKDNHWKMAGDKAAMEEYTTTYASAYNGAQYFTNSSGAYSDASYIRIKTISLAYDIPHRYLAGIKMEACSIYFSAQNLFTFSGYKGDPEVQNIYAIPPAKIITGGLQITF